ncbi:MAG: hypothetical protein RL134_651 [Actinomycetota bacterium]|jgi:hypothetical protein
MNRAEIQAVIESVTGAPVTGLVADITPGIVDALDAALNPPADEDDERETRVIEAAEKR